MTTHDLTTVLGDERYLSLTTFRANGDPVPTPVWFVPQPNGTLLAYTEATSGKVKRLRRNPECTVAACDARGRVHGEVVDATADVLDDQVDEVYRRLVQRYGWQARAFDLLYRLRNRGQRGDAVGLRLSAAQPG
ncbi:MAG: PPOX class F420-dependent oxidoreductase [Nitriliruptoraceae bacterium]